MSDLFLNARIEAELLYDKAYSWVALNKAKSALGAVVVLGLWAFVFFGGWADLFNRFPQVEGANFSIEYKKVPFDIPSLDITFSSEISAKSVTAKSVKLSPFVDGQASVKDKNTISYTLSKKMTIGEEYVFEIADSVTTADGKTIGKTYLYTFQAIAGAKVTKIFPSEKLENLAKPILVLFNIPVVATKTLKAQDALECPITITPSVAGKCRWLNGNILEFRANKPFNGATKYSVNVASKPYFLYPIAASSPVTFSTPALTLDIASPFSPKDGIQIRTNFAIDTAKLKEHVTVGTDFNPIAFTVTKDKNDDKTYYLKATAKEYMYSKVYALNISSGITSLGGNMAYSGTGKTLRANNLITNVAAYRKILSATGQVIDTVALPKETAAINGSVFYLDTEEKLPLQKDYFKLTGADGKSVDFTLAYGKIEEGKMVNNEWKTTAKENPNQILLTPTVPLQNGMKYTFSVLKLTVGGLEKDESHSFSTPKKLEVTAFEPFSNTQGCLYVNNALYPSDWNEDNWYNSHEDFSGSISLSNSGVIKGLRHNKYDAKTFPCQRAGSVAYMLDYRLAPNAEYTLNLAANLEDGFGNRLGSAKVFNFKTGPTPLKDRYIYLGVSKDENVIPTGVPLRFDVQSINADKALMQVCTLDEQSYLAYFRAQWEGSTFSPVCTKTYSKWMDMKNHNWSLAHNVVDFEKDVVGSAITDKYFLLQGSLSGNYKNSDENLNNENVFFSNLFVRTNLSLTTEQASDAFYVFASDLEGKTTPSDLAFSAYSSLNGKPLSVKAAWMNEKKTYALTFGSGSDGREAVIFAQNATLFGVQNPRMDSTSNYDFKYVAGQSSTMKDFLYLYTDRPLYKRGDTVFYKGILRSFDKGWYVLPKTKTGSLHILDAAWQQTKNYDVKIDKNGNFEGSFVVADDTAFGPYSFEFWKSESETVYTNGSFYVDSYKKPTFKVALTAEKNDFLLWEKTKVDVAPTYYFGGQLANTTFSHIVQTQKYFFNAKDYADYQFGEGYEYYSCVYWGECGYSDNTLDEGTGAIDGNGKGSFEYAYNTGSGETIYTHLVSVTDPQTGKSVTESKSDIVHATDGYVGVKAEYYNAAGKGVKAEGVVLGLDAKPLASKSVTLTLIHKEWKEVKKQGVDGVFYKDYTLQETKESSLVAMSDKQGAYKQLFLPKASGEYTIQASYAGSNGKAFVSSLDVYVDGDNTTVWNNGNNTVSELAAEKTIYKIGEIAKFTLQSPIKTGKMFVSIEKDDAVLDTFVQDITSNAPVITLPIKESYLPNIYVKVFAIGKNPGDKLPTFKRALSIAKIVTDFKKLSVSVSTDKKSYLPGDKIGVNIKVTDSTGKAVPNANGSLSVVDESLLALAGNPSKNPFAFFYDMKRYLGVETMSSLMSLIEKLEIMDTSDGEKGGAGDGAKGGDAKRKRGVFKDTAFWVADFTTDATGTYKTTLDKLPDNLTSWALEALVSTADTRVGVGLSSVTTQKKVMVSENLPQFLGSADKIVFTPSVFNKTGQDGLFGVDLTLNIGGSGSTYHQDVYIANGKSLAVQFPLDIAAPNATSAKITISAKMTHGNEEDTVENTLPVYASQVKEVVATAGKVNAASASEWVSFGSGVPQGSFLKVTFALSPLYALAQSLPVAAYYNNAGAEERTAMIVPFAIKTKLATALGEKFDPKAVFVEKYIDATDGFKKISVDEATKNYLIDIQKFQLPNGWFTYWIPEQVTSATADLRLTASTMNALTLLSEVGYSVDKAMYNAAEKYLTARLAADNRDGCKTTNAQDTSCKFSAQEKLEALSALVEKSPKNSENVKMLSLLKLPSSLSAGQKVLLAQIKQTLANESTLDVASKKTLWEEAATLQNDILSNHLVYLSRGAFIGGDDESSRVVNTARFMKLLANAPATQKTTLSLPLQNMLLWMMSLQKSGQFGSNQETTAALDALADVAKTEGVGKSSLVATLRLNGKDVQQVSLDSTKDSATQVFTFTGGALQANNAVYTEAKGNGSLYYGLEANYMLSAEEAPALDEGFFIERTWYSYTNYANILAKKTAEMESYLSGTISYSQLKYPNEIWEYLTPTKGAKVGDLVLVRNHIISAEDRDNVVMESSIPSGTQLVNTNLQTENKTLKQASLFVREENRDHEYFGYIPSLKAGEYEQTYVLRATHEGSFNTLGAHIYELDRPEVFGRSDAMIYRLK